MTKTIIIVDDYRVFREGLKLILEKTSDFELVGEASEPEELFHLLETTRPHVILLSLLLPAKHIVNISEQLERNFPDIYLIVLAVNAADYTLLDCVIHGARGIIWKETSPAQLVEAIKSVSAGERYLTIPETQMAKQVISHAYFKHADENDPKVLSSREQEVVKWFAKGLSYKEIGKQLGISPRTVESHKNNILSKLNLNSVNEMLSYAIKHRIIQL